MQSIILAVSDLTLRDVLIQAATTLEKLWSEQKINSSTTLQTMTNWGLRIDYVVTPGIDGMPSVIDVYYLLNTATFRDWVNGNEIAKKFLAFSSFGVSVIVKDGKWDKAEFRFYNVTDPEEGYNEVIQLPLLHGEAKFRVHRNLQSRQEWCVYYEKPTASQTVGAG